MSDIGLQNIDVNKLETLGLYELRNLGRAIGVSRPTMHARDELISAIKKQLESGEIGAVKATSRGRKPRENSFDMTKLVSSEPSYFLSVLDDDYDLYKVRSGETGTEKRTMSGFVHLLSKGSAVVVGVDLNGYNLPVKTVSSLKLCMGDFVEGTALFSETRQAFVVDEIFNITKGPHFDSMEGVRPNKQYRIHDTEIKQGTRILVATPKSFDRVEDIAKCCTKDFHTIALLADETDDSVKFLKDAGIDDIYLAKVNYNLKKQVLACLLCMFRAKQLAESGRNVVLVVDSLTKLFKLYNNSAYPEGRITPGEVVLGPLTDLKSFFMSARTLCNGGALTIIAYINSPENSVEEYVFNEFVDLANILIKK